MSCPNAQVFLYVIPFLSLGIPSVIRCLCLGRTVSLFLARMTPSLLTARSCVSFGRRMRCVMRERSIQRRMNQRERDRDYRRMDYCWSVARVCCADERCDDTQIPAARNTRWQQSNLSWERHRHTQTMHEISLSPLSHASHGSWRSVSLVARISFR